jgi:hypothetical protein
MQFRLIAHPAGETGENPPAGVFFDGYMHRMEPIQPASIQASPDDDLVGCRLIQSQQFQ